MEEKEKASVLSVLSKMGKWFWAFVAAAVLLVAAIVTIIIVAVSAGNDKPDTGVTPPSYDEGPETGIYYYDAALGEYEITLNSGNKFSISGPDLNKSGEYTVADTAITFDFLRDEDGTATATLEDDILTLSYNDVEMRFLKKVYYTVSFDTCGGSTIDDVTVINGKLVSKPDDPAFEGNVFLGWYADSEYSKSFGFGTTPVFGNTTVYAKWAAVAPGAEDYTVSLNMGSDAAEPDGVTVVGGKLAFSSEYTAPTREGYSFVGWYVSVYEDGAKLTYEAKEGTAITADTTLFAVWQENSSSKLPSPAVSIAGNSVSWNAVTGAVSYQVTVKDGEGNVVTTKSTGATTESIDFSAYAAGDYSVEVVATANDTANSSEPAIRWYRNKSLDRVSSFSVVGSTLVFSSVANAEKYVITIDCGNDEHKHTLLDNGKSTVYDFSNCSMQKGGIVFTVIAKANNYADSIPAVYTYSQDLDKIGTIIFDETTQTFTWKSVANATNYYVTITCGNHTHKVIDNGSITSFSVKSCSGDISISVVPVTAGYNSPEATSASFTKTALATPENIAVHNMTLTWDAIEGADNYVVKIDGKTYTTETNEFDLTKSGIAFKSDNKYSVTVQAVSSSSTSAESDAVVVSYLTMGAVSYHDHVVSWAPVAGALRFEVKVNNEASVIVEDTYSLRVTLTKEGVNTIQVRTADFANAEWTTIEVTAYKVVYESRSNGGSVYEYVANGDTMSLPDTFEYDGFDFAGWYNTPGAAQGNGAQYNGTVFNGNGSIVLYANWSPATYYIELVGINSEKVSGAATGDKVPVRYTNGFELPVLTTTDTVKSTFAGWYTGADGTGTKLTDYLGNSVVPYNIVGDYHAYPYFTSGMIFELNADGESYSVTKGPDIKIIPTITIPATYNGLPVTGILSNGFYNCDYMLEIKIPDSIKSIGANAFHSCDALVNIEVYDADPTTTHEIVYSSDNGVLLYTDPTSGIVYLELYPRAKAGSYTVPSSVSVISHRGIYYARKITSLTIPKEVHTISTYGVGYCTGLTEIIFEEGGTTPVSIAETAFYGSTSVKSITLPSYIKGYDEEEPFNVSTLNYLTGLQTINVNPADDAYYSTVEGMLCNPAGDTILYCPKAYPAASGLLSIPSGISAIGPEVFRERNVFVEITIPNYVTSIGEYAFAGCENVEKITIAGSRNKDLAIADSAFYGCSRAKEIIFAGNGTTKTDKGATTIGPNVFANLLQLRTLTVEAGANIAEIGASAFTGNIKLRNINVADSAKLTRIAQKAFAGCENIVSFTIPATTTFIGDSAFEGCVLLSTIIFAPNGKDIDFGSYVFKDCYGLSEVQLPATVKSFDGSAFDGCYSISEITVDPANSYLETVNGVLYDEDCTEIMFYPKAIDDPDLSELPWDTLTKIGNTVFKDNTNVTNVTIPATITAIGNEAFNGCTNLESVTIADGSNALTVGDYAFANLPKLESVVLPDRTTYLGDYAFYVSTLSEVTMPADLTYIGDFAFAYTNITSLTVPAKVSVIGDGAFAYSSLETITIEDGETELKLGSVDTFEINFGFESPNYSIYSVTKEFPEGYDDIGVVGVFRGSKIGNVSLPARVISIGAYAFYETLDLSEVTFAENSKLTSIGTAAFYASAIESINLENTSLETIGEYAFATSGLVSTTLPKTLTTIGRHAFANASGLTELNFTSGGSNPLTIKPYAFKFTALTSLSFPDTLAECGEEIQTMSSSASYAVDMKSASLMCYGNTVIASVSVDPSCERYGSLDGVLYEKDENGKLVELLWCPTAKTGDLKVPNTVTLVGNGAFNFTKLTSVTFENLPDTDENYNKPILEIGSGTTTNSPTTTQTYDKLYRSAATVFANSTTLQKISFPAHLKSLASNAVFGNKTSSGLTLDFNMDASDVKFEVHAIYNNNALKELNLPRISNLNNPTYASNYTFGQNSYLTKVTFHKESTFDTIPAYCFYYCQRLAEVNNIPSGITSIGNSAFYYVKALTKMDLSGTKVVSIGQNAFNYCTELTEFVFPDTATEVLYGIFGNCTKLTKVTIGLGLESLECQDSSGYAYNIFYGAKAIKEFVVSPDHPTLKAIDGVIYDYTGAILAAYPTGRTDSEPFVIPETVREIGPYAFQYYQQTSIVFPSELIKIGRGAFYYSKLASVTIPASVTSIDGYAFYCSTATGQQYLKSLAFEENSKLESIGPAAFYASGLTTLDLPDNVTTVGTNVFGYSKQLKTAILPAALTDIAGSMFYYCEALTSVTVQENVRSVGSSAFSYAKKLQSFYFPEKLTTLGTQSFYNTESLKTLVNFENSSVIEIPDTCFYKSAVVKVVFPATLEVLGKQAFREAPNVEYVDMSQTQVKEFTSSTNSSVNGVPVLRGPFEAMTKLTTVLLPETLEVMSERTFMNCTSLESIAIPASVTSIGAMSFEGCTSLSNVQFAQNAAITELGEDPNVESAIFRGTTALNAITLPESITSMGANIFENSGISLVSLPDNLSVISASAFKNCKNLTSLDIPSTVTDIYTEAFMGCDNLEDIVLNEGVEFIDADAFANCTKITTIHIPASVIRIGGNPFSNCTGITSFTIDEDNENFVYGTDGVLYDANVRTVIFYPPYLDNESYTMPSTVFELAKSAFTASKLKNIVISDNIKVIPDGCFKDSKLLETVYIPLSVTSIGTEAFYNCESLSSLQIPEGVISVGPRAFSFCLSLDKITLPQSLSTISEEAFFACTSLTELKIPARVTSLGSYIFAACTSLAKITLPDGLTSLGMGAFQGCESLAEITLPDGLTDIGAIAFSRCTSLAEITLPKDLTSIGSDAFQNCKSLVEITIPNSVTSVDAFAFMGCDNLASITILSKNAEIAGNISDMLFTIPDTATIYGYRGSTAEAYAEWYDRTFVALD